MTMRCLGIILRVVETKDQDRTDFTKVLVPTYLLQHRTIRGALT